MFLKHFLHSRYLRLIWIDIYCREIYQKSTFCTYLKKTFPFFNSRFCSSFYVQQGYYLYYTYTRVQFYFCYIFVEYNYILHKIASFLRTESLCSNFIIIRMMKRAVDRVRGNIEKKVFKYFSLNSVQKTFFHKICGG